MGGMRTAAYMGAGIAVAIAGIYIGLSALEGAPAVTAGDPAGAASKQGLKQAPGLAGIAGYINTTPEGLADAMEGKVVLYDIWTYSCINCIRTLPHITAWDERYSDDGLLIVGIHSPEFEFEKNMDNVQQAVEKYGIAYPVVMDNDKETWKAFENRYWPRKYIADHEGYIRYDHIGEGAYDETERVIQELLAERAAALGMQVAAAEGLVDIDEFEHTRSRTPELYFGYQFAYGRDRLGNPEGFVPENTVSYTFPDRRDPGFFYVEGDWLNTRDGMTLVSESGAVFLEYTAKEVNIVAGGDAELRVTLDGVPISGEHAGRDVVGGSVSVGEHDLYNIVDSQTSGTHKLLIEAGGPGLDMFTFTFG